jgi:hypothetical protein
MATNVGFAVYSSITDARKKKKMEADKIAYEKRLEEAIEFERLEKIRIAEMSLKKAKKKEREMREETFA